MKETQVYLKQRWESDFSELAEYLIRTLTSKKSSDFSGVLNTKGGLMDLRGYQTPKYYTNIRSNSGKIRTFVESSISIKNKNFINVDFSFSDFERCIFENCHFENCIFYKARFVAAKFKKCKFSNIVFDNTNFAQTRFEPGFFDFIKLNFSNITFNNTNMSECSLYKQGFDNCFFNDFKGILMISESKLKAIQFLGLVENLFLENLKLVDVDFRNAKIVSLQIKQKSADGFKFSDSGDNYFRK